MFQLGMDWLSLYPTFLGGAMALFGVILTIRTRHKRPAITATWHEERSASSDPGGSERVITIRQDDDEAKWQVFSVTVQGCRDNLVSRRGCEKTYQRLRLITPYVGLNGLGRFHSNPTSHSDRTN